MKIAVLGTGSWGTALAQTAADNGHEVILWGNNPQEAADINENHRNSRFFGDTKLIPTLKAANDIAVIHDADIVLAAVPTGAMEEVLSKACTHIDHPVLFINVAKGYHPITHERMIPLFKRLIPEDKRSAVVSLIGPSHAEEVILRQLTAVTAVSENEMAAALVQTVFSNDYFRVYRNTDEIGAETGVALKNIMAIAAGILEGSGQGGDNARAALMTRGLAEMTRFGVAAGGKAETFLGLDGVGDLIVTCTSMHSRNFTAGLAIGKSGNASDFLRENKKTVEGIAACKVVHAEAKKKNIEMPITEAVYQVLFEDGDARQIIHELMHRSLKAEM